MPHVDLLELPYFEGLSIDGLVSLVDLMEPVQYEPGELLMKQGDPRPQPLFIATRGHLKVTKRTQHGRDTLLAELKAPTLFGEIELFCQIPPVCSAEAITQVAAFTLTRKTFDTLFAAHNPALLQFTFNVARVACHRLAIADELLARGAIEGDVSEMRKSVWAQLAGDHNRSQTTGLFNRNDIFGETKK